MVKVTNNKFGDFTLHTYLTLALQRCLKSALVFSTSLNSPMFEIHSTVSITSDKVFVPNASISMENLIFSAEFLCPYEIAKGLYTKIE